MTEGSTHSFYTTPDCDMEFWYRNLRASLDELKNLPEDADHLTVSNQLIKLRETILDTGEKGVRVTVPPGIYYYPYQTSARVVPIVALAGMLLGLPMMFHGLGGCQVRPS